MNISTLARQYCIKMNESEKEYYYGMTHMKLIYASSFSRSINLSNAFYALEWRYSTSRMPAESVLKLRDKMPQGQIFKLVCEAVKLFGENASTNEYAGFYESQGF